MIRLLRHHMHRLMLQRMLLDMVAFLALAAWLPSVLSHMPLGQTLPAGMLLGSGVLMVNNASGFYERHYARPFAQTFARGLMAALLALAVVWLVMAGLPAGWLNTTGSESVLKAYAFGSTGLVVALRSASSHWSGHQGTEGRRVLVVGTGDAAHAVVDALSHTDHGIHIVGHVPAPSEPDAQPEGLTVLEKPRSLVELADQMQADEVLLAVSDRRGGATPLRELLDCRLRGYEVNDINTHFERTLGQIRLERLSAHWLIFGDGFNQGTLRTLTKRVFDLVAASLLLVLGLPIMALAAVAIKLESRGPVIYRQERTGLGGQPFLVRKLRSMRTDAEGDGKPRWATTNDNRITRVGRFIRATRIDELPQLFNVLSGEMSLVGPRPERPFFVEQLARELPFYAVRHSVKPGLTGWAQVRCDYGSTVEEARDKLQYDLYYVKNHSLFLDLLIVLETVGVVLTGKGAR